MPETLHVAAAFASSYMHALLLALLLVPAVRAVFCEDVGLDAPSVVTLFQSPTNATEAVVLGPDCTSTTHAVHYEDGDPTLRVRTLGIKHVESYPSAYRIYLDGNNVQTANFSNDSGTHHLILAWNDLQSLDGIELPAKVFELDLEGNMFSSLAADAIPESAGIVYMGENNLLSMDAIELPDTILRLYLHINRLTSANFTMPSKLKELYLDSNPITELVNTSFPETLQKFNCTSCGIETIKGVTFPAELQELNLEGNSIATFEIRQSDVSVFKQLSAFNVTVTQQSCEESSATALPFQNGDGVICVISDELFAEKYRDGGTFTTLPGNGDTSPSAVSTPSSSRTAITLGVICLCAVIAAGLAVFGYRKFVSKSGRGSESGSKHSNSSDNEDDAPSKTPPSSALGDLQFGGSFDASARGPGSREYLPNDIRNDEALLAFRIEQAELRLVRTLATGGFGTVFQATYRGQVVAVKQLRSEKARDIGVLKAFMAEIRLYAGLEHPHIVAFMGVAWSTLVDVALVMEYMARGDLGSELRALPGTESNGQSWFEDSKTLKRKLGLSLGVAEALVYLHSFDPPIIHRDLKARNVLLTAEGDSKLSDFGVSRTLKMIERDGSNDPVVATMTAEMGTVAWMAPELLQGGKYSERADIYSFGVLLVELDTCRHPFDMSSSRGASSATPGEGSQPQRPANSTQFALMVAAGELAPSVSRECPPLVAELAAHCLQFDPAMRPSAVEIHYKLRRIAQHEAEARASAY